jgi:pimeloyl-ACP methyl ester carboxylesterase
MTEPSAFRTLPRDDGATIAYHRTEGRTPGVVFLPGFRSDMTGGKATALEAWCRAEGRAFLRFDYTGHGASSGEFEDGTIGAWADDAVFAIDRLTEGPQVLVGSSMGGWIMLLAALARPERVAGLVGIAAAPDFTREIESSATPEMRQAWETSGVWYEPSQYSDEPTPFTLRLVEDGRKHLLLERTLPFDGPVRLIHGMKDPDVPWELSMVIADRLTSADVELVLVKGGDHRLSEPHDIDRLCRVVGAVCDVAGED